MEMQEEIHALLIKEIKRRLIEESIPRILKCLTYLNEEEIWYRPNENTVSTGNLILHLMGNVNQWIVSALGGVADNRIRTSEFDHRVSKPKSELISGLKQLSNQIQSTLNKLSTEELVKEHNVQGYNETTIAILIHVTEHFSYHTGQITYIVKSLKNVDTQYYTGVDLNKKN